METGPVKFHYTAQSGVFIQANHALKHATILARFIQNPCQLSRDGTYLIQLATLAELLLSCSQEDPQAEELRRAIQSRVMR